MNYYTVCPDCGYKLLKAGDGSKHATKATGKEQVPPVAFCAKPHASPCASLRSIGHRKSDASLHSAITSLRSLRIPLSAPSGTQLNPKKAAEFLVFLPGIEVLEQFGVSSLFCHTAKGMQFEQPYNGSRLRSRRRKVENDKTYIDDAQPIDNAKRS